MADAESIQPHPQVEPSPELTLIHGGLPEEFPIDLIRSGPEAEPDPSIPQIDERNIFGTAVLPTSRDGRLISLARSLYVAAPGSVNWLDNIDLELAKVHPSVEDLASLASYRAVAERNYVAKFIASDKTINGSKSNVYFHGNARAVIIQLWEEMTEANHPAYQLAEMVRAANVRRRIANERSLQSHQDPFLTKSAMYEMLLDLIYSTQSVTLIERVKFNLFVRKNPQRFNGFLNNVLLTTTLDGI